jgi:hypothetical protein
MLMEKQQELDVRSEHGTGLRVERTDISFHDLDADRVRIQVRVHNAGPYGSPPTPMRIESAPLGAFVPWRPLTRLLVPALEPGESTTLSAEVKRPHPVAVGDFNRVPPKRLLTAVNSPDEPAQAPGPGLVALLNLLRGPTARSSGRDVAGKASLAPDLWDLVGRSQPYWAGNLNVFIGVHAVERHLAKALRVYPGRTNLAMFMVGDPGRRDAYAFELVGLASDWEACLHDVRNHRGLLVNPSDAPIAETKWVEADGGLIVVLATRPPADCPSGTLEVHVTRRSCGKTAIVEFDLDPTAQGTGCYSV